ncbi:hypothetical protein K9M48_00145 [Candidatus Gracilibacteria bacterium]|nr:hypothetical protein [Candidatus Gracilibacteria bacterium]
MDLIAISYKNIGPFKDKLISVFFDNGKYLIKAPIGTGKSFLFFDGPMYALYKHSTRNLLNINSKDGFIKILFDFEGEKYLIVRNLLKGKNKDSCQSVLFKVDGLEILERINDDLLTNDIDIQDLLKDSGKYNLEEIKFKNETDLQLHLNSFLEPKEVFLSTVFLMQDTDNIFEMLPSERLNVLKNIFRLIGIDEAKDEVAEKKRDVVAKIKANEDSTNHNFKLRKFLEDYIGLFQKIREENLEGFDTKEYEDFFDEIERIQEKININEFSISDFPKELNNKLDEKIETQKSFYQNLINKKDQFLKSKTENENNFKNIESDKKNTEIEMKNIEDKIKSIDPNKIKRKKEEKKILLDNQLDLEKGINVGTFENFCSNNKELIDNELENKNMNSFYLFVRDIINKGRSLDGEKKNILLEIKNFEDKINTEIKNLNEKKKLYDEQYLKINQRLTDFNKNIQEQEKFECEKIGSNCPFIKIINKKSFDSLEEQKLKIEKEKIEIEEKIKNENIDKKIVELNENLKNSEKKHVLVKKIEEDIKIIKEFLEKVDYKNIEIINNQYQNNEIKIKSIDKEILDLESDYNKLKDFELQIEKNKLHLANIENKEKEIKIKIEDIDKDLISIDKQVNNLNIEKIKTIERNNTEMKNIYRDIDNLIEDFKRNQILVKGLKEEEKILNNLYLILSKELLLLVLQDNLPILNEIVNVYLNQSVDYQVSFDLIKTSSDKLELEIKILDEKGERDVKSLSGGQKIILKLVWMLAISSYIRSPILFLDETINNLDVDTVGKVADMIEDFVKSRNMKFFVVTHSQQIQDMEIWDKVLEIGYDK